MKSKVRLALIATYPTVADIFIELTRNRRDLEAVSIYASFDNAAAIAEEMERKGEVDVILSRGGTAAQIQSAVTLPIIQIPITPFDVIRIVHQLESGTKKVALIHYMKHVSGVQEIAQMYGIQIEEYSFLNRQDIESAVYDAYRKGVRAVIGGEVAVRIAKSMGMKGYQISAGRAAVEYAIDEALNLFEAKRKERNKAMQMQAAYASLKEGIIVTDEDQKIVVLNPVADMLFDKKYKIGDKAGSEIIGDKCRQVYQNHKECPVYLKKLQKNNYAVAHIPIIRKEKFIGVVTRFENVTHTQELEQKIRNEMHLKGFVAKHRFHDIITQDESMKRLIQMAKIYAKTDSAVLIEGESGTGKELLAQSIHNASARSEGPFVAINCAAIAENLLESELFGYEAGSFTGAKKEGKPGLFELAHNGTLFLDEIGEISKSVQTRLLRVLQEKEIMRIGGERIIPVDVRIISATNRNLKCMSQDGSFRGDLYYRLNVLHLDLPPLRRRMKDVPVLAKQFLEQYEGDTTNMERITSILTSYSWPGNIRELQNAMERYSVLSKFMGIADENEAYLRDILGTNTKKVSGDTMQLEIALGGELNEMVEDVEQKIVQHYLEQYDNNQELAAKALGIGRTTFWRKIKGKKEKEG
ncbi:MAG: sigma 54-interacting transcriptional regulator [Brotaphodocola sp.]